MLYHKLQGFNTTFEVIEQKNSWKPQSMISIRGEAHEVFKTHDELKIHLDYLKNEAYIQKRFKDEKYLTAVYNGSEKPYLFYHTISSL